MKKQKDQEKTDIYVSESVLQNGLFGVYAVSSLHPDYEIYLAGGFKTIDEAKEKAKSIVQEIQVENNQMPENKKIDYRKREEYQLKETFQLLEKANIVESISSHINQWFVQLNKKSIIKGLLSYGNLILYGSLITLWIFWKDSSFTVPSVELPIVGKYLSGKVLDRELLATYYPIALFVLFSGSFFRMLRRNLAYNNLRKKILYLVKEHSWNSQDFVKLIAISQNKSDNPIVSSLVDWLHTNNPNSLNNLIKYPKDKNGNTNNNADSKKKADQDLANNLQGWIQSDFDQRFHNLLYLGKEKDFRPSYMSFDPIIYLISNNRTIYRLYSYLHTSGFEVHEMEAPIDPYQSQKVMPYVFWVGVLLTSILFGGTCLWSLLIEHSEIGWTILGVCASISVLVLPNWWNFMAIVKKRGFPSCEPIGAYTVGLVTNRLSLVGW